MKTSFSLVHLSNAFLLIQQIFNHMFLNNYSISKFLHWHFFYVIVQLGTYGGEEWTWFTWLRRKDIWYILKWMSNCLVVFWGVKDSRIISDLVLRLQFEIQIILAYSNVKISSFTIIPTTQFQINICQNHNIFLTQNH